MIAQPKIAHRHAEPETIKAEPGEHWPASLIIECEVTSPKSAAGRTVHVRIPAAQIPAILKAARTTAIALRSQPESRP